MRPKKEIHKSADTGKAVNGFTDEERAAMKERAQELKAEARAKKADGEGDVLAKIAEMPEPDRAMAVRLHAIVKANAPALSPRTWYGIRDARLQRQGEPRRRNRVAVAFALKHLTAAAFARIWNDLQPKANTA